MITPEIESDVLRRHSDNPKRFSPFKVARQTGIPLADVLEIIARNQVGLASGVEHHNGEGREDLRPFVVAKRRVIAACWDNKNPAIAKAREDFAAGTHTMATHRDGSWLLLCSFPLTNPIPANPHYFDLGAT